MKFLSQMTDQRYEHETLLPLPQLLLSDSVFGFKYPFINVVLDVSI